MTCNLKALGLALLAVLALGAIMAQGASAHKYVSTVEDTVITGEADPTEPTQVFVLNENKLKVSCSKIRLAGTVNQKAVEKVELHPRVEGCELVVGGTKVATTIATTGCNLFFEGNTAAGDAPVSVNCTTTTEATPKLDQISFSALGCTLDLSSEHGATPVNQGLLGLSAKNVGSTVTGTATVTGIKVIATGANCGLLGLVNNKTYSDGAYSGKVVLKGFKYVSGPTGTEDDEYVEGEQVTIKVE